MDMNPHKTGNVVVLSPQGRIDHAHSAAFKEALDAQLGACTREGSAILLDMGAVEYISSVGLRALMIAARQVKGQGGRIALAALTPVVREVFEISRFDLIFPLYESRDAALQALGSAA